MAELSVSVVIRAYNEAERLRRLLNVVTKELVEVVVVDNGSTDHTAKVIAEFAVKSVHLPQEEFSYPKSANAGIAATTGDIVVMYSAHCLPEGSWRENIVRHFKSPHVGGVYTVPLPEPDSPLFERVASGLWHGLHYYFPVRRIRKDRMAILDFTNAAFRRSLWEQHPLDETYGAGGEDGEFARWMLVRGYHIIRDLRYRVRHSHYLTFGKFLHQQKLWRSLRHPRPFNPSLLAFRDDIKRS